VIVRRRLKTEGRTTAVVGNEIKETLATIKENFICA
jgi:hypothetical protein